jgi:glycosyltransferase involved in cell wall biosynthesis
MQQTFTDWELIVVDDGSTDDTRELILTYTFKDQRIRYLSNQGKKGPAAARNYGIQNSRGEYFAFLDSDDEWLENHLLDSMKAIQEENVAVCFSLWLEKNHMGEIYKILGTDGEKERLKEVMKALNLTGHNQRIIFPTPGFFEFTSLKTVFCCHINAMVCNREVIERVGPLNQKLAASEDWDLIFRIIHEYPFCLIQDYHFVYNQGDDNIHSFVDRRNIDLAQVLCNARVVDKLTFCGIYKCKALQQRKILIKKSTKIQQKELLIQQCNRKIGLKYFTMGFLNKNVHPVKAIFYLFRSLPYQWSRLKIKLIMNTIFPFLYKRLEITVHDLWLN